jgi:hypothetical protein
MSSYFKHYDPSKTLSELIDGVLEDLYLSVLQGNEGCLEQLQLINELMVYLRDQFYKMFQEQFPGFEASIVFRRYGGGQIELCLSFLPLASKMALAKLLYDSLRVYKRPFGIILTEPIGTRKRFARVDAMVNSPFGTVPVKDLYPHLCAQFMDDMEDELESLDVVMNYISGLPVSQQMTLGKCSQNLFLDPDGVGNQGVSLSRFVDPVWHQSLCEELAAMKTAVRTAKGQ